MTNEELATTIQRTQDNELIFTLWQQVKNLFYMKASQSYRLYKKQCDRAGIELADIKQSCYLVYRKVILIYKPEQEYKFTAYIDYTFKNMLKDLLGIKNENTKHEPLNNCISLSSPQSNSSGDNQDIVLEDTVEDKQLLRFVNDIDSEDEARLIHQAVNDLQNPYKEIIQDFYFNELTYKEISKKTNYPVSKIQAFRNKALSTLRHNKVLLKIYNLQNGNAVLHNMSSFMWQPDKYYLVNQMNRYISLNYYWF